MLRLKNPNAEWPKLYPKVVRYEGTMEEKGWVKVDGVLLRNGVDYIPQPGLQEEMITEDVDIQLLGGQPGAGKSFGLLLAALDGIEQKGYGCLIVKKQLVATKEAAGGIIEDAKRIYGNYAGCEFTSSDNPTFSFPSWNTAITFTHANFSGDTNKSLTDAQEKFKNFQISHLFIDEATDHKWSIINYLLSRNRDSSGVKSKLIMTFNTNSDHWTRQLIDWWIDEKGDVIKERIGVVRYCWITGSSIRDIVWGNSREEVIRKGGIVVPDDLKSKGMTADKMVKSVIFRPSRMVDNMVLLSATKGGHAANIFNLGGTETGKLFYSNWNQEIGGESTVSKEMIKSMWENPQTPGEKMYASLDVAGGGDNCVLYIWKELTIIAIENFYGDYKELEAWIKTILSQYHIPIQNMAFDATGVGSYLKSYTDGRAVTANMRPLQEYDEAGNPVTMELYFNIRSQLMGKTQYLLETGQISCKVDMYKNYPHGKHKSPKSLIDVFYEEIDVFRRTTKTNGKFYFKNKDEFKDRYGYSPDYMDALIYRSIFELDSKAKKEAEIEYTASDYAGLYGGWG